MTKTLEKKEVVITAIHVDGNNPKKCDDMCEFYAHNYCMRYDNIDYDKDYEPMVYRHEDCIKDFGI